MTSSCPKSAQPRVAALLERIAGQRELLDRDLQAGDADVAIGERGNLPVKRLRAERREPAVDELASRAGRVGGSPHSQLVGGAEFPWRRRSCVGNREEDR